MSQFDVKMTALADAIKAKNGNVTGKLSVQAMIDATNGISVGADVSGVTATPEYVLNTVKYVDKDGILRSGEMQLSSIQSGGSIVMISKGFVPENQTVTLSQPELPDIPASDLRYGATYNGTSGTFSYVGDAEFAATSADLLAPKKAFVNGEEITGSIQPYAGPFTVDPSAAGVTAVPAGVYLAQDVTIPPEPAYKAENIKAGVSMWGLVGDYGGDDFDFSSATNFSSWHLVRSQKGYNKNGELIEGSLNDCFNQTFGLFGANSVTSDATEEGVWFYWSMLPGAYGRTNGGQPGNWLVRMREDDCIAENIKKGKTILGVSGALEDSAGYYIAKNYEGTVDEIEVTAGTVETFDGNFSLKGTYKLEDGSKFGIDRVWCCEATTADGDYASTKMYLRALEWEDYGGSEIVVYTYWGFTPNNYPSADMAYIYSKNDGLNSPLDVTEYETGGNTMSVPTMPVITSAQTDTAPYGPTGWTGELIEWTDEPVLITKGAGVEVCNGYWKKVSAPELATGYTYKNCNGKSWMELSSNGVPEYGWVIAAIDLNYYPNGKSYWFYDVNYDGWWNGNDTPKNPWEHGWDRQSSAFGNIPTFIYSETGGMFPSGKLVTGLTIGFKAPQLGKIYNSDATVEVAVIYP